VNANALPSELLQTSAVAQCAALLDALKAQPGDQWALDASALQEFDSSAISVLLQLHRDAKGAGKSLRITGVSEQLSKLAALYGVTELLTA
jgi:phospholipid transport system transporter-binding protein